VVSLALPQSVVPGFVASCVLLTAYTVAIGLALRRGERTPCRCIGASADPLHALLLLRNGVLLAICGLGFWATAAAGTAVYAVTALAASVAIAFFGLALVTSFDDLVFLARSSPP
jgi:hydrogenase/urease accessory protein HupE